MAVIFCLHQTADLDTTLHSCGDIIKRIYHTNSTNSLHGARSLQVTRDQCVEDKAKATIICPQSVLGDPIPDLHAETEILRRLNSSMHHSVC